MAVPKQRHTKSRRNRRRSHHALKSPVLTKCQKCGTMILPHIVCFNCGFYKNEQVVDVMKKLDKKQKKQKEKEISAKQEAQEDKKDKSLDAKALSQK
ncbi:MAG: 50S ribosomal protein L32 [Patescibacteria group bacterium]|nr:50S ribosomal protein L32 [Patescibacteria group bacterium]